jgi:hypothetical protein
LSTSNDVSEATAHTVLNYAITEAVRQKKSVKLKLQIPYSSLAFSNGEVDDSQYEGIGLIFTATLKWAPLDDEDVIVEEQLDEEQQ